MNIKEIQHTADMGFEIKAKTYEKIFNIASKKILQLALIKTRIKKKKVKRKIVIKAQTIEELLHNFLNQIIYFIFVKKFYITKVKEKLKKNRNELSAEIEGFFFKNIGEYIIRELKSVTYHNLEIIKEKKSYKARIIIDI